MSVSRISQDFRAFPPSSSLPLADTIKKIALICLKELAISLAMGAAVICFVPFPSGIGVIMSAIFIQLAVSAFFHSVGAFASYKSNQRGTGPLFKQIASICDVVTGANFGFLTGYNTQTLIHETGHSLAALALYKRPFPQIEIYPFSGGFTQFYKTSLTAFGKKIGPVASTCFVIASGPGFTLLISSVLLTIGLAFRDQRPQLSKYLIAWGIIDFLSHAKYAYSALYAEPWNLSHDFVHLSIFGLNPAVAAIGIIALPIVLALGVEGWRSRQPQSSQLALV